jgi:hypothetical protein
LATLLLSAAVSTASARNLEISNQNWRVVFSRLEFQSPLVTVRCHVTLEGSFHSRTIPKRERLLIGAVSRVTIQNSNCTNGTTVVLRLPWHITYESFTGTLPDITSINGLIDRFRYGTIVLGRTCLYGGRNILARANLTAGVVGTLQPVANSNSTPLLEGPTSGIACPGTASLVAGETDGVVTLLSATTLITIRLI